MLAQHLLTKGYQVAGTSRRHPSHRFGNLALLGILDRVTLVSVDTVDPEGVRQVIANLEPDEIYNLAGQSSVGRSFEIPGETYVSIVDATRILLETIRDLGLPSKIFTAGSGDCFGDLAGGAADETTPFNPQSPYAEAKVAAFEHVEHFRRSYGLFACTGILFNHESFLRPSWFVTRKIVNGALEISAGRSVELMLGDIFIRRDWGWAPEYVDAMWRMLQIAWPEDFVIATGTSIRLVDFVETVFTQLGLDWRKYVKIDPRFIRSREISRQAADPSRAFKYLGWKARYTGTDVARLMMTAGPHPEAE